MKLGELINRLETQNRQAQICFDFGQALPGFFHSYRGDYSELGLTFVAREYGDSCTTVGEFLGKCQDALCESFTGWKGGTFRMDENTPIYIVGDEGTLSETIIVDVKSQYNGDYVYLITESLIDCD